MDREHSLVLPQQELRQVSLSSSFSICFLSTVVGDMGVGGLGDGGWGSAIVGSTNCASSVSFSATLGKEGVAILLRRLLLLLLKIVPLRSFILFFNMNISRFLADLREEPSQHRPKDQGSRPQIAAESPLLEWYHRRPIPLHFAHSHERQKR